MSVRFEVLRNGQRVCLSGINGDGVLSTVVNYVKHAGKDAKLELNVGGLGQFNQSLEQKHHADWSTPELCIGDEITIRVLPAGDFDDPVGMTQSPKQIVRDSDFGDLKYHINAWDGDIQFDCAPFTDAHIHLVADELGPSEDQRRSILELIRRFPELWPEIATALIRCHSRIDSRHELDNFIIPRIGINIYGDSDKIELNYRTDGDPEHRSYFVTLRNWTIIEVCEAN